MKSEDFIKIVNTHRRKNKNTWYSFNEIVENKKVKLSGYNTWLRTYLVDGTVYSGLHGLSVKEFKEELSQPFR
jgi:hypothetical protein